MKPRRRHDDINEPARALAVAIVAALLLVTVLRLLPGIH